MSSETVQQLRKRASKEGLRGSSRLNKAQLLSALRRAGSPKRTSPRRRRTTRSKSPRRTRRSTSRSPAKGSPTKRSRRTTRSPRR